MTRLQTLVAASLLALALRVALMALWPAPPAWDGAFYLPLARALADGHGYAAPHVPHGPLHPTAYYPVGYPMALRVALFFVRAPSLAAWALNLLACLVALASIDEICHRAGLSARRALLLYALAPGPALWCVAAMSETLTGAALSLSVALCLARSRWGVVLSGAALGAATLVRPQSLLAAPWVGVGRARSHRARALLAVAVTACALSVVAPWSARNARVFRHFALVSTNGGVNLYIGTLPDAVGGYRHPSLGARCAGLSDEVSRDRCASSLAWERIRRAPARWALLGVVKLARTLAWEPSPALYVRNALPGALRGPRMPLVAATCTLAWWALVALAALGFRRRASLSPEGVSAIESTLGSAASVLLAHAVFIGDDRYHLAVVPLVVPAAAHGWRVIATGSAR